MWHQRGRHRELEVRVVIDKLVCTLAQRTKNPGHPADGIIGGGAFMESLERSDVEIICEALGNESFREYCTRNSEMWTGESDEEHRTA